MLDKYCNHCAKAYIQTGRFQLFCSRSCACKCRYKQKMERIRRVKAPKILSCPFCKKDFTPHNVRQKYCTRRCQYRARLAVKRQPGIYVECARPGCGQVFEKSHPKYIYCCLKCRQMAWKIKLRQSHSESKVA